jgi:predicted nucleic acid-binding Zn ribbon protein
MNPYLKQVALTEWRGLDYTEQPLDNFHSLGDLAKSEFERLGLLERFNETAVASAWRKLVGDFVATHTRPVSLQGGVLLVQVLQPTVRFELERMGKPIILAKLRDELNIPITDLRFQLG